VRRGLCRLLAFAITAGAVGLVPAGAVSAHTTPVGISPTPGARLEEPPGAVVVRFDDELDTQGSELELVDDQGEVVALGGVDLADLDHRTMRLTVPADLPEGAYGVRWQAQGVSDGHVVPGEAAFAVGAADPAGALSGDAATPRAGDPSGASDRIAVTPWLVAFAVAATFLVIAAALHGGRRSRTSSDQHEPASRAP
jgi:methionine-rich copper-binding protein CopC